MSESSKNEDDDYVLDSDNENEDSDNEIDNPIDEEHEEDDIIIEDDDDEDDDVDEDKENNEDDDDNMLNSTNEYENNILNKKLHTNFQIEENFNDESEDEEDDEDETPEFYLQKFDKEINKNYVLDYHPESNIHNYEEIYALTKVVRDKYNNIIDDLHITLPYLTKYEKARILGQRAKQINSGSKPFVKVPENIIDGYLIAELELKQKRIPFIIRRPTPCGGCEYWSLKDLEVIDF
jgi:DNA-directed RNA polymerase I, II, and III subunit RPABC2